jgi:uncharacterized protein (TIGR02268 family)
LFQSAPLALLLVLLGGTAAPAQVTPRELRQRTLTLTGNPAAPPDEVHVAPETPTVLLFGEDILKKAVRVDGKRIRVVDAGERSLIVQPVSALGQGEREELEVLFADGKAPQRAVFALVSHPSEVDTLLNVERRELLHPTCPTEGRRELREPEDLLLLDYMDDTGVPTAKLSRTGDEASGLRLPEGVAYRGKGWLMFKVTIENPQGPQPWVPAEATLAGLAGVKLRGRVVRQEQAAPAPGKPVEVLIVTEEPPLDASSLHTLELSGEDGQSLSIDIRQALAELLKSPEPTKERKP